MRFKVYVYASPGVIYVPPNGTIQGTINNASSGDTIIVPSGTYRESLNINKSLSIVGENSTATIIDGDGAENVISISSNDVTIESLTITKTTSGLSGAGVFVSRSTGVVINDVQITNTSTGLTLDLTTNCAFSDDVIANNTSAVLIYGSNGNVFSNNAFLDSSVGVDFSGSLKNQFYGNTFSDNVLDVFLSSDSYGNVFYHNNFLDENPILVDAPSTNVWSANGEGNYWASYNFSGPSTNGIGDEPYYIDENNQDNYPLMGIFSSYDITYNNEEFQVTIISNSTVTDFTFEVSRETGYNIVSFSALGEDEAFGFCRMTIPNSLMEYQLIVVDSEGEVATSLLSASDNATTYLYFTYLPGDQSITVISSEALQLQSEYATLQADFDSLNATYQALLSSYNTSLAAAIANMNSTYEALLNSLNRLQSNYLALNSSLQNNLANQSQSMQNIHNLTYVFAATAAAFLIITVYLSTRANGNRKPKASAFEEEGQPTRAASLEEY